MASSRGTLNHAFRKIWDLVTKTPKPQSRGWDSISFHFGVLGNECVWLVPCDDSSDASCFKVASSCFDRPWPDPRHQWSWGRARSSVGDVAFPGHGNKLQPARCQHSLPKAKAQHTQDANSKEPGGTHRGVWTRREGGKQFLNLLNSLKWYLHSSFIEVCDFCLRLDQSCCFRFWRRSFWFSTCPLQWLLFL